MVATARGAFDVEIPIENPGRRQSQIVVPTGRTRRDRYRDPRRDGNVFWLADASLRLRPGLGLRAAARKKAAPILRFGFEEGAGVATTGSSFHWIDANHPAQRASSFQPGAEVQSSVSTRGRSPVERLACDERRTDGRRAPRRQCNGRGGGAVHRRRTTAARPRKKRTGRLGLRRSGGERSRGGRGERKEFAVVAVVGGIVCHPGTWCIGSVAKLHLLLNFSIPRVCVRPRSNSRRDRLRRPVPRRLLLRVGRGKTKRMEDR